MINAPCYRDPFSPCEECGSCLYGHYKRLAREDLGDDDDYDYDEEGEE